jgi:TRAP-type C4-dicarboxylate transport system permease small subunit
MAVITQGGTLPHGPVGQLLERICVAFTIIGGFVLVGIMLMESASVLGRILSRWLPVTGIAGDSELVQIGCATAIFSFLPLCQLQRGNVFVDFFTKSLPLKARSFLDALANLLFLALTTAIAWQLMHGTMEKFAHADTTTILRIPESWPYLICLVSAWLLVATTLYTLTRSISEIRLNRQIGPQPTGDH